MWSEGLPEPLTRLRISVKVLTYSLTAQSGGAVARFRVR